MSSHTGLCRRRLLPRHHSDDDSATLAGAYTHAPVYAGAWCTIRHVFYVFSCTLGDLWPHLPAGRRWEDSWALAGLFPHCKFTRSAVALRTDNVVSLSEQQFVHAHTTDSFCNDGLTANAFEFACAKLRYLTASGGTCSPSYCTVSLSHGGETDFASDSEQTLMPAPVRSPCLSPSMQINLLPSCASRCAHSNVRYGACPWRPCRWIRHSLASCWCAHSNVRCGATGFVDFLSPVQSHESGVGWRSRPGV